MPPAQAGYIEEDRASVLRPDHIPRLPRYTVALCVPCHRERAGQQLELADRRCLKTALSDHILLYPPSTPFGYTFLEPVSRGMMTKSHAGRCYG